MRNKKRIEKIIEIKAVKKDYGDFRNSFTALYDINLDINKGEFIGIMGPSGSGKSTLLNLIATIDEPTTGRIYIDNNNLKSMSDGGLSKFRRENIGFIFQDCNLLDTLTLRDNILAPLILAGLNKDESNKRVSTVAKRMDIEEILDKYPAECSGGQNQRAATCRALASNPKIIVADEPTAALDTKNSVELLSMLKKLNEDDGITIVMVTHDPLIASYCSKVVMIRDGKLDSTLNNSEKNQIEFYNKILRETAKETESIFENELGEKVVENELEESINEPKLITGMNYTRGKFKNEEIVYGDSTELLATLDKLNKNEGINIVMVTNNPKIASHCSKIVLVNDNKIDKVLEKNDKSNEEIYSEILLEKGID